MCIDCLREKQHVSCITIKLSIVNVVWYDVICYEHRTMYVNKMFIRNANDVNTSILASHQPRNLKICVDKTAYSLRKLWLKVYTQRQQQVLNEMFIRNANDVNTSILASHQPRVLKICVDKTFHAFQMNNALVVYIIQFILFDS